MVCCIHKPSSEFAFPPDDKWTVTPWGRFYTHFTPPDQSVCFKTLVIECGHQLSLQYHHHRAEFWFISDKNSHYQLTLDEKKEIFRGERTVSILRGQTHSIMNMSSFPLIIYEMQYKSGPDGKCCNDDIVRLYDPYSDKR